MSFGEFAPRLAGKYKNDNAYVPAFLAYVTSDQTNVTGDGTILNIPTFTVVKDQQSNFNSTSGIFTAPLTGLYYFFTTLRIKNLAVGHTAALLYMTTTQNTIQIVDQNPNNTKDTITGNLSLAGSIGPVPMKTGDTCILQLQVAGSTKTVTLAGVTASWFGGYFIC